MTFQEHIAEYLVREHGYPVLEQGDITDPEHCISEDHLWSFLKATQKETLEKLAADYGTDAREEIFKTLWEELRHTPLWMLFRHGLHVRGLEFRLFYPRPRSSESVSNALYGENRITFRHHFTFGDRNQELDFALFLNGLPIVALELKHKKTKPSMMRSLNLPDGIYPTRFSNIPFFTWPPTPATSRPLPSPSREENFRWHNTGLTNQPASPGEYPVEFLYREVLSKEHLLEALSFFLVQVPQREADEDRPERPAQTLFPRYHQSRMVRKVSDQVLEHFQSHRGCWTEVPHPSFRG